MPKIIFYTLPISPPCRAVHLICKMLGVDVEIRLVEFLKREQFTPEFLKLNPHHTVPVIIDGDTSLWDSHAIIPYLVTKYGKPNDPLYPDDIVTRARIQQHLNFDTLLFDRLRAYFEPIFYRGSTETPQDKIDHLYRAFDLLEAVLQDTPYLVGNSLTVADISVNASAAAISRVFPLSDEKYPKTNAWIKRLEKELPFYDEIHKEGIEIMAQAYIDTLARNKANAGK